MSGLKLNEQPTKMYSHDVSSHHSCSENSNKGRETRGKNFCTKCIRENKITFICRYND